MRRISIGLLLAVNWLQAQNVFTENELNRLLNHHGKNKVEIAQGRLTYNDTLRHLLDDSFSKPINGSIDLTKPIVIRKQYHKEHSVGYVTLISRRADPENKKYTIRLSEVSLEEFEKFAATLQSYRRK